MIKVVRIEIAEYRRTRRGERKVKEGIKIKERGEGRNGT